MSSYPAIPTRHRGINFRSRLEARWAEFFTLIGWKWLYEPIDLEGYIPDFMLRLQKPHGDALIEVKPFLQLGDPVIETAMQRIENSSWVGIAVVVGAAIDLRPEHPSHVVWGWLRRFCARTDDGRLESLCSEFGVWFPEGASRHWLLDQWHQAGNAVQWRGR